MFFHSFPSIHVEPYFGSETPSSNDLSFPNCLRHKRLFGPLFCHKTPWVTPPSLIVQRAKGHQGTHRSPVPVAHSASSASWRSPIPGADAPGVMMCPKHR